MNAFDLGEAMGRIDDRIIQEVISTMKKDTVYKKKTYRRIIAFAAALVLSLSLGLVAYAANLFGIQDALLGSAALGDHYVQNGQGETVYAGEKIVPATVLSLVGYANTPEYKAAQEFTDFYNDYVANDYYGDELHQPKSEWGEAHRNVYNDLYTSALENKFLEICEKYGLKPRDAKYEHQGSDACDELCRIIGIESFLDPEGRDSSLTGFFTVYNDGSFHYDDIWSPEGSLENVVDLSQQAVFDIDISRSRKGYAGMETHSFGSGEALTEWAYTTSRGDVVDLIMGENAFLILYDGVDAFVSVKWDQIRVMQSRGLSLDGEDLERYADGIDFRALGSAGEVSMPAYETNMAAPTPQP